LIGADQLRNAGVVNPDKQPTTVSTQPGPY
jgi:hypothetical protein